ncbi:MAG: MFS transporter, partial [Actinomycetota bacterium]|nr:MFS transporter [Actinomycetota bacterium]
SWAVQGGTSRGRAGLVTTAMLAFTVLAQLAVPALERRFGVARVLAGGMIALGAPAPFYLLSHDLGWLCVISAVRGTGFAVLTVLGSTLTTRVAPAGRIGEAVGVYGLAIAGPSLVGVPAGAALTLAGHFAWVAVPAAAPVLALMVIPLVGRAGADPYRHKHHGTSTGQAARAALGPSMVLLVVTLAGGGMITFLPIERPHGALAGIALLVFGITGALTRWRAGVQVDRSGASGARTLLSAALGCAAVGLAAVAVLLHARATVGVVALVVAAGTFGVGFGAVQNITLLLAFGRAGRAHTSTASALWNASFDTGTGLGAFGVGAVSVGVGLSWTYAGCALLILATVPVALLSSSRTI